MSQIKRFVFVGSYLTGGLAEKFVFGHASGPSACIETISGQHPDGGATVFKVMLDGFELVWIACHDLTIIAGYCKDQGIASSEIVRVNAGAWSPSALIMALTIT